MFETKIFFIDCFSDFRWVFVIDIFQAILSSTISVFSNLRKYELVLKE